MGLFFFLVIEGSEIYGFVVEVLVDRKFPFQFIGGLMNRHKFVMINLINLKVVIELFINSNYEPRWGSNPCERNFT